MTIKEQELWNRISCFQLDEAQSALKFSERLARENKWTIEFTQRVMEEYKRFIFLCCVSEKGATPSDEVDQVWHLHMIYTQSYWNDWCRDTLRQEIHHHPTKGGTSESEKYDDLYTHTLDLYREKFVAFPPSEIWPDNSSRFSDVDFERVNRKKYWLLKKPQLTKSQVVCLLCFPVSVFFIQAANVSALVAAGVIMVAILLFAFFYDGNGSGGSGCGSSCGGGSCSSACSGCSSSGCSGCGGGCGGGCGS